MSVTTKNLIDDIRKAKQEIDSVPVLSWDGFRVVESPFLEPMGVVIMVGSEYMKKLKEQTATPLPIGDKT